MTKWASHCGSRSNETPPSSAVSDRRAMGGHPESPTTTIRWRWRCGDGTWADSETRMGEVETRAVRDDFWQANKKKMMLTLLDDRDQSLFQRVGPQRRSSQPWPVLVTFCPFTFNSLTLYLSYFPCTYLYLQSEDMFKCPSLNISGVPRALPSFFSYRDPEVYPCVLHLTPGTTKPICSSWHTLDTK